jgi:tripartite-type tricarboxylate transporter receptor subunit TctC
MTTMPDPAPLARSNTDPTRRRLFALATATAGLLPLQAARAAGYPDKPIRIVLGFAPGGPTDVLSRILGDKLSKSLGTPVVVDNKVGAGGNIAAGIVAKAPPDGYTLLVGGTNYAIGRSWYKNLSFDVLKDLQIVATISSNPNVLVVNPESGLKTLQDVLQKAKADPGKLTFASSGTGTVVHLAGEIFKSREKLDITHVPYGGAPPAELDLMNGRVSMMFDSLASALPFIRQGKMRAIGVTSRERSTFAPDIPSLTEVGLKDFDVTSWYAVWAPAHVPAAIIERLNRDIGAAVLLPDVRERLVSLQAEAFVNTVDAATKFQAAEVDKWTAAVEALGPRPE